MLRPLMDHPDVRNPIRYMALVLHMMTRRHHRCRNRSAFPASTDAATIVPESPTDSGQDAASTMRWMLSMSA